MNFDTEYANRKAALVQRAQSDFERKRIELPGPDPMDVTIHAAELNLCGHFLNSILHEDIDMQDIQSLFAYEHPLDAIVERYLFRVPDDNPQPDESPLQHAIRITLEADAQEEQHNASEVGLQPFSMGMTMC